MAHVVILLTILSIGIINENEGSLEQAAMGRQWASRGWQREPGKQKMMVEGEYEDQNQSGGITSCEISIRA